jgi:peroxiredoxin
VPQIEIHQLAPDFALKDYNGRMTRLSDYRGKKNVLLVFNRGFM